jgi:hypothetical protein
MGGDRAVRQHAAIRWHFLYSDDDGTIRLCGPCWSEVSQIPTPLLKEYEVGYLYTRILCDPPQDIRIAVSSPFRHKMWIDGELAACCYSVDRAEREVKARLNRGVTQLLIKLEKLRWWEWKLTVQVRAGSRGAGRPRELRAPLEANPR